MTQSDGQPLDISKLRQEIDRVDTALLSLIAERLDLARSVRDAKSGSRVWRPSREDSLIRHLADISGDTSAHLVSRIWAELMSASLALQGPIRLHIALEGDAVDVWSLVRDRFGAAIPMSSYPTASSALAAAYSDPEGVAILPSPQGMNTWWSALCEGGAMPDMHILAGLPRVSADQWPRAVAVSTVDVVPSNDDRLLLTLEQSDALHNLGISGKLKAESGPKKLIWLESGQTLDIIEQIEAQDPTAKFIGYLSLPLSES